MLNETGCWTTPLIYCTVWQTTIFKNGYSVFSLLCSSFPTFLLFIHTLLLMRPWKGIKLKLETRMAQNVVSIRPHFANGEANTRSITAGEGSSHIPCIYLHLICHYMGGVALSRNAWVPFHSAWSCFPSFSRDASPQEPRSRLPNFANKRFARFINRTFSLLNYLIFCERGVLEQRLQFFIYFF